MYLLQIQTFFAVNTQQTKENLFATWTIENPVHLFGNMQLEVEAMIAHPGEAD
jgi:hypothetical protein